MVEEYYRLMGWDPKSGKPWRKTLERFGLTSVAHDLWG
jgi:aldehyde:ferredoxin oxidoreductase